MAAYADRAGKRFVLPEWGFHEETLSLEPDDPGFVEGMHAWLASRPYVTPNAVWFPGFDPLRPAAKARFKELFGK